MNQPRSVVLLAMAAAVAGFVAGRSLRATPLPHTSGQEATAIASPSAHPAGSSTAPVEEAAISTEALQAEIDALRAELSELQRRIEQEEQRRGDRP